MNAVRFDQDREAARWFDTDRVAVAWFDEERAGAGAPPPRTLDSSNALPLGGTVVAAVAIVAQSSQVLPFAALSDLDNPIVFEEGPPEQLPLGGTSTMSAAVAMDSSVGLPMSGSATLGGVAGGGGASWIRRRRPEVSRIQTDDAPALAVSHMESRARLPMGGVVLMVIEELTPEGDIVDDEVLDELLAVLVS